MLYSMLAGWALWVLQWACDSLYCLQNGDNSKVLVFSEGIYGMVHTDSAHVPWASMRRTHKSYYEKGIM